jgi:hypothetical protein
LLAWGTFTVCSAVSAIGFASANRTFTVDSRTVQAALNQSRLASLEADQSELRRLRDRLASSGLGWRERAQLAASVQRLETALGSTRNQLEVAAPVVSTPNPQAHTLAKLTGLDFDKVEVGLVVLVALLVELGGFGPFITMKLAMDLKKRKVPSNPSPAPKSKRHGPIRRRPRSPSPGKSKGPIIVPFTVSPATLENDLRSFLDRHSRRDERSALGSSELLTRYNRSRCERRLPEISQRRLGDAMGALGYRQKPRLSGGRIHYGGMAWARGTADAYRADRTPANDMRAPAATLHFP